MPRHLRIFWPSIDIENQETTRSKGSAKVLERLERVPHVRHRVEGTNDVEGVFGQPFIVKVDHLNGHTSILDSPFYELQQGSRNVGARDLPTKAIKQQTGRCNTCAKIEKGSRSASMKHCRDLHRQGNVIPLCLACMIAEGSVDPMVQRGRRIPVGPTLWIDRRRPISSNLRSGRMLDHLIDLGQRYAAIAVKLVENSFGRRHH